LKRVVHDDVVAQHEESAENRPALKGFETQQRR